MASEIEQLPDLTGIPKIASQPQWRRVQLVRPADIDGTVVMIEGMLRSIWRRLWVETVRLPAVLFSQGLLVLAACSQEQKELMRVPSPDHATTAIVVQEIGGGAAISSTYYVYLLEGNGERAKPVFAATYCGGLSVAWQGPKTLLIDYHPHCHIRQFTNEWWNKGAGEKAQGATAEIILVRETDAIAPAP